LRAAVLFPALIAILLLVLVVLVVRGAAAKPGSEPPTPGVTLPGASRSPVETASLSEVPSSPETASTPATSASPSGSPALPPVPVGQAAIGTCFDEKTTADAGNQYVWPLNCTAAHDAEVYFNSPMDAGDYPADDAWSGYFQQYCVPAFAAYVGVGWDVSKLDTHFLHPSAKSWRAGDRLLTCYVVDPAGARTSSVKGSQE
jgi:hypothetical protein